jgi:hypothetical protein
VNQQGLGGRALQRIAVDDDDDAAERLAAWVTSYGEASLPFTRADLLEHHAIVSRIHAHVAACLPARFPTWLSQEPGDEDPADTVRRRRTELAQALDRVRGRSEIGVTARWTAAADAAPSAEANTPGTRYLLERRRVFAGSDRRRERARELADEIERLVADDLVDVRRQLCPSTTVALSSALLVPRQRASELIERLPRDAHDVRILVHGPWPPYTFAATG